MAPPGPPPQHMGRRRPTTISAPPRSLGISIEESKSGDLAPDVLIRYGRVFSIMDRDRDGVISCNDLKAIVGGSTDEEAEWILRQFSDGKGIDLDTFARVCEAKRNKEWNSAYCFAMDSLKNSKNDSSLDQVLLSQAGVEVSKSEAEEMSKVLNNQSSFLKALNCRGRKPAKQPIVKKNVAVRPTLSLATQDDTTPPAGAPGGKRPQSPFAAALMKQIKKPDSDGGSDARPKVSPFADVMKQIQSPRSKQEDVPAPQSEDPAPQSNEARMGLIFFDGTGDASQLPAAGPSISESKFPPPVPPPLPS